MEVVHLLLLVAIAVSAYEPNRAQREFNEWLYKIDPANNKVAVASIPNMGSGLIATQDVQYNDTLLRIPMKYVVCRDTVLDHLSSSPLLEDVQALTEETAIISLFMLLERAKGQESEFYYWIQVLPTDFSAIPMFWTDEQLHELDNEELVNLVKQHESTIKSEYEQLLESVLQKHFDTATIEAHYSYKDFMWPRMLIDTRAWHFGSFKYLVPAAGMFNHQPAPADMTIDWNVLDTIPDFDGSQNSHFGAFHEFQGFTEPSAPAQFILVRADRDAKAGEQLYERYGNLDDYGWVDYHGFVPEYNPYSCYPMPKFSFDEGSSDDPLQEDRKNILLGIKMYTPGEAAASTHSTCLHERQLNANLLVYFALPVLTQPELTKCIMAQMAGLATSPAGLIEQCFTPDIKQRGYNEIVHWAEVELSHWKTTIQDDLAILFNIEEPVTSIEEYRLKVAVEFRMRQKGILASVIDVATTRAASEAGYQPKDEL